MSTVSLTSTPEVDGWLTPRDGRFTPVEETRYSFHCPVERLMLPEALSLPPYVSMAQRHRDNETLMSSNH